MSRRPMTDSEREELRIAQKALLEARARALARGLTPEQITREEDDEESQFWDDVEEIGERLRQGKSTPP